MRYLIDLDFTTTFFVNSNIIYSAYVNLCSWEIRGLAPWRNEDLEELQFFGIIEVTNKELYV